MVELLRTNDVVLISFIRALLAEANIEMVELDTHASIMDGSVAMIQRRIMIDGEDERRARQLLKTEGLGEHLRP